MGPRNGPLSFAMTASVLGDRMQEGRWQVAGAIGSLGPSCSPGGPLLSPAAEVKMEKEILARPKTVKSAADAVKWLRWYADQSPGIVVKKQVGHATDALEAEVLGSPFDLEEAKAEKS